LASEVSNIIPANIGYYNKNNIVGETIQTAGRELSFDNLPTNTVDTVELRVMSDEDCSDRITELNGHFQYINEALFCTSTYPAVLLTIVSTINYINF
jgi:hypothetical protein